MFATLYSSQIDQTLIKLTEVDHRTFRFSLALFEPLYNAFTPYSTDGCIRRLSKVRNGRCRLIYAQGLALSLTWYRTPGSCFILCPLLAVTHSVCSIFLRFGRRILLNTSRSDLLVRVTVPTTSEIRFFSIRNTRSSLTATGRLRHSWWTTALTTTSSKQCDPVNVLQWLDTWSLSGWNIFIRA